MAKLLTAFAVLRAVNSQSYDTVERPSVAFSYVQPLNATILDEHSFSPPFYPSPNINATADDDWGVAVDKARVFAAQLTIEEKADMVTGQAGPCVGNIIAIARLGFHGLCLHDGPLAIRVADYASVFSAGVSVGASWDRVLMHERGLAMGNEFKAKGAHVALGPVAGPLGRSAYAGRNWEGFASDPYLSGVAMEETITGYQDAGVQATAKHWIGNEQETLRNPIYDPEGTVTDKLFAAVSSNIDDRTMHELYMWPFANAVKAKVASVMCAYQRLNGSHSCQNAMAQNGLLKTELGFQGYIMSDWGATHSGVASIEAGLDMNMPEGLGSYGQAGGPQSFFGGNLTLAVKNGTLDVARVDDMVVRIMTPYFWLGQDQDFPTVDPSTPDLNVFSPRASWTHEFNLTGERSRDVRGDHGELIRRHGAAGTVLLKNMNGALPLKAPKVIAIFGNDAGEPTQGFLDLNYEYGTLVTGGGSGSGHLSSIITPLRAIQKRAAHDGAKIVQYWLNNTLVANSDLEQLLTPQMPDVCLVLLKTWAEEAADRNRLSVDWDGDAVVESVASTCTNTIVVTHSAGINTLPWSDHPNITAILAAHYPGEQAGYSLADILYGDANPSGHLPYTIACHGSDYNAPPTTAINTTGFYDWQSWFDERLEIDYRYFDAHDIPVRYEFGFGLSYTTFDISDLRATRLHRNISSHPEHLPVQPGGNPALWECVYNVTISLTNSGDLAGASVPQLYVGFPLGTPAGTPPRQLRGFEKVYLEAGETQTVGFELMRRDLSYWDVVSQQWVIPEGEFAVYLGFSSRDLIAQQHITVVSA